MKHQSLCCMNTQGGEDQFEEGGEEFEGERYNLLHEEPCILARSDPSRLAHTCNQAKREFFIDNLLVRIHVIIEMILLERPCAMGV